MGYAVARFGAERQVVRADRARAGGRDAAPDPARHRADPAPVLPRDRRPQPWQRDQPAAPLRGDRRPRAPRVPPHDPPRPPGRAGHAARGRTGAPLPGPRGQLGRRRRGRRPPGDGHVELGQPRGPGGARAADAVGVDVRQVLRPLNDADAEATFLGATVTPGVVFMMELQVRHADGAPRWLSARAVSLLEDPAVRGVVVNLHDITDQKQVEDELAHQAFHDSLTGLANRALFADRAEQALRRSRPHRRGPRGAVPRPRRVQEDQRQPRPPRRRRRPQRDRGPAGRIGPRRRHRRPARRRRVRHPHRGSGHDERDRPRHRGPDPRGARATRWRPAATRCACRRASASASPKAARR